MNITIKKLKPLLIILSTIFISVVFYKQCFKKTCLKKVTPTKQPTTKTMNHLAIIMDGNRRWAKKQGKPTWFGHKHGAKNAKMAVEFCVEYNIPYLTLYSFSTENFKRPQEELSHIFDIIVKGLSDKELQKLIGHGVKIKFVGKRSLFPEKVKTVAEKIEKATQDGDKLTVNILFAYGGRLEITSALKSICKDVKDGKLTVGQITEKTIENNLWMAGCPDPDLIIRTGKRNRLSNFLAWQNVYSELLFSDKYWPAITKKDLKLAVADFEGRKRTYGS